MSQQYDSEKDVKEFLGHSRHVRGIILRLRFVGIEPALTVDGRELLGSRQVWDFLLRTPKGRYLVVRGTTGEDGQPHGSLDGERRRKDAEDVFARLATLAEPCSGDRGGGAILGGFWRTPEEFARMKASGEVANK